VKTSRAVVVATGSLTFLLFLECPVNGALTEAILAFPAYAIEGISQGPLPPSSLLEYSALIRRCTSTGFDLRGGEHLLLVTVAALCYAVGSLLIHGKLAFVQPLGIATTAMLVSTAVLLVPGLLSLPSTSPSPRSAIALVALGIVFTGVTLTLFYGLIRRAGPARATLAFYLSPAVTVVLGWQLLHERVSWSTAVGLLAVVVGSAFSARRVGVEG
jgi:uncharacterized membrane protein